MSDPQTYYSELLSRFVVFEECSTLDCYILIMKTSRVVVFSNADWQNHRLNVLHDIVCLWEETSCVRK